MFSLVENKLKYQRNQRKSKRCVVKERDLVVSQHHIINTMEKTLRSDVWAIRFTWYSEIHWAARKHQLYNYSKIIDSSPGQKLKSTVFWKSRFFSVLAFVQWVELAKLTCWHKMTKNDHKGQSKGQVENYHEPSLRSKPTFSLYGKSPLFIFLWNTTPYHSIGNCIMYWMDTRCILRNDWSLRYFMKTWFSSYITNLSYMSRNFWTLHR